MLKFTLKYENLPENVRPGLAWQRLVPGKKSDSRGYLGQTLISLKKERFLLNSL